MPSPISKFSIDKKSTKDTHRDEAHTTKAEA